MRTSPVREQRSNAKDVGKIDSPSVFSIHPCIPISIDLSIRPRYLSYPANDIALFLDLRISSFDESSVVVVILLETGRRRSFGITRVARDVRSIYTNEKNPNEVK